MKLHPKQALITCITAALLLSGCTAAASQMESSSTVSSGSQSDEAPSEPTAQPSETPEESSAPAENRECTDLSFLTEEQQQVYRDACELAIGIYGLGRNLAYYFDCPPLEDAEGNQLWFDDGVGTYELYNSSYEKFTDRIHRTFTDNCLDATDYDIKFIGYNGILAVNKNLSDDYAKNCSRWVMNTYPDAYRFIRSTENEVVFTLISHYDRNWGLDTYPKDIDLYTVERTIRMVNTDDGWKIDEFHTTEFG